MADILNTTIEAAINAYLHQDHASRQRLTKLAGKSIAINLNPFSYKLYCCFNETDVSIKSICDIAPNAEITGTPLQLVGVMLAKESRHQFFADDVNIAGDAEVAQEVVELFDNIRIDWAEHTSRIIGDVPAHQLSELAGRFKNWITSTRTHLHSDVSDYLHEETEWFPVREELNEFFSEIDTLRMDTDRLEARLNLVKSLLALEEQQ